MIRLFLFSLVTILIGIVSTSPSAEEPPTVASPPQSNPSNFIATITEYRFKTSIDPEIDVTELLKQREEFEKQGSLESVETLRVNFREGSELAFQLGKQIPVVTGSQVSGSGRTQQMVQMREVGMILKLFASKTDDKISVKFEYDTAKLEEPKNDLPAAVAKMRVSTTLLVDPKKPVIVSHTKGEKSSFIVLQID